MRWLWVSAALVAALIGFGSVAGEAQVPGMVPTDRMFVMHAAEGGAAEVALGRLAAERAINPSVRQFGQRMVTDHGAANAQLATLAARKGVELPREPGAQARATYTRLSAVSGPEFDRAYMAEMVRDHDEDVREFEAASQSTRDADLRAWVVQTLPTLRQHQAMARQIHGVVAQAPPAPPVSSAPAALPGAVVVRPGVVAPAPWCQGGWNAKEGTNFGTCR